MIEAAVLVLADHGNLVSAVPFVLPAFLIVGTIVFLRHQDRKRDTSED